MLANWKDEIDKSYKDEKQVFSRILIAQSGGDLAAVQRSPGSRDVVKSLDGDIQYGLGFGDGTQRSLDCPGSCVLTTYQTLRNYRFSFAKAEWSAVIFDEAQHIKNPNAFQTISAKALKSSFRLALTGTPVENHLGDLWCIIDTVEPGALGSFAEFRRNWIQRMMREKDNKGEIGEKLREHIGKLMLRRLKEEELKGLPPKQGTSELIPVEMTSEQISLYNSVLAFLQEEKLGRDEPENKQRTNRQLAALWHLRQISLHPDLLGGGNISRAGSPAKSRAVLRRSGKLSWLLQCLDEIRNKNDREKVLVFCVQKKLQEALSFHLGQIYEITIPVINGDTKASSKAGP